MEVRAVLIFAVVLLASGCISQSVDQSDNGDIEGLAMNNTNSSDSNTIYFTGSGFEPSNIIIEEGETVTWVNNASASMWVASNDHPEHTEYDGTSRPSDCNSGEALFDQCSTGGEYSFTFNKTGTWGYHNHRPFVQGGRVVVE
jgi:plastocyanin